MPSPKGIWGMGQERLAVTSIGMVTSVGHGAVRACASIRAGLARPAPLPYFSLVDPASGEASPLTAHPIRGFSDGFQLVGRWLRLAHAVMQELLEPLAPSDRQRPTTAVIAALPICDVGRFGIEEDEQVDEEAALDAAFLAPLCALSGLSVRAQHRSVVCEGHAAAAGALGRASALLERGEVDQVVVVGVDSYLDPGTLEWLGAGNRLHGPAQPDGLVPGEAAAGLVVTSERRASARGERAQAFIPWASSARTADHSLLDGPGLGAEWASSCGRLLEQPEAALAADVLVDLNGERWRGEAFGHALARVSRLASRNPKITTPAASLGDVGASTGCVHACLAVRSFERRSSRGAAAVVMNQADDGRVGAILVQAAG